MQKGLFSILLLTVLNAQAGVYMTTDPNGNVSYSDLQAYGSSEVATTPSNTTSVTTPPVLPKVEAEVKKPELKISAPDQVTYSVFNIESPKDQETIQNQPIFKVTIKLEPALQAGDKIQLVLDQNPYGNPTSDLQIEMVNVDRGEHRLYAVLLDARNTVIKRSNEITIFIHRASVGGPPVTLLPIQKLTPAT